LPELPRGSVIEVGEAAGGVELRWANPGDNRAFRYCSAVFLLVWSAILLAGFLVVTFEELRLAGASYWLLVAMFFGAVLVVGLLIGGSANLLRPRQPEFLLLGHSDFVHRSGTAPFPLTFAPWWQNLSYMWALLHQLKRTTAGKDRVSKVRLEGGGRWESLAVYVNAERIEIGKYLSQPEREWLAEALWAWLAQG